MEGNMTVTSKRMFEQATAEIMTVREAVDFLEKEAKMRTLRDKLEKFAQGRDLQETLTCGLWQHHPDMDREFIERRVDDWLNNPVNQMLRKRDAIEICFILGLSVEEADAFTALACEEGLHWRNPDEIVYIFALKQGMDYLEAEKLNEEMMEILPDKKGSEILMEDNFTPIIRSEVAALRTREELIDYLTEAAIRLGRYHNNAYRLFVDMMDVLEHPKLDETEENAGLFDSEKLTVHDVVKEYLCGSNVLYAKERIRNGKKGGALSEEEKRFFTIIQKKVSDCWPNETALEKMKSREADVTRKVLILLFLATDQGPVTEDEDDMECALSRDEVFEDIYQRLNDMLLQCGFMTLDPRAPFDWLIIYCICVDDMFDVDIRMKAIFKEMFGERD